MKKDGYDELTIKNKFIKFTDCENLYENINEMVDEKFEKFDDTIDYDYSENEITIEQFYKKIKISNLHIEDMDKTVDDLIKYLTKKILQRNYIVYLIFCILL